jgi:hypothetical protein
MLCAFIINTSVSKQDDDEADQSLVFCCGSNANKSTASALLKGLSLAVRGALESLCGEKARRRCRRCNELPQFDLLSSSMQTNVLRLGTASQTEEESDSTTVIAFTHLKQCMVALALPGRTTTNASASSLALYLTQVMVLCAGSSSGWMETPSHFPAGATKAKVGPARIKRHLVSLFDRLSEGVLQQAGQASSGGWVKVLPLCTTQTGLLFLQLDDPERQSALSTLLKAHEVRSKPSILSIV